MTQGTVVTRAEDARVGDITTFSKAKLRTAAIVAAALLVTGYVLSDQSDSWGTQHERVLMRPAMEQALAAGSGSAAVWLAMNFHQDYPDLLAKESGKGEPQAMFYEGLILQTRGTDGQKVEARALIHRAALAGCVDAVRYEAREK